MKLDKVLYKKIIDFLRRTIRYLFFLLHRPWIKIFTSIVVIIFLIIYFYNQFVPIKNLVINLQINLKLVFLSFILIFLALITSAFSWREITIYFGYRIPLYISTRIHFVSILGKYVPGYIMQFGSKVLLSNKENIPISTASKAVIFEFILTNLLGFIISLFFLPFARVKNINVNINLFFFYGVLIFLFLVLLFLFITGGRRNPIRKEVINIIRKSNLINIFAYISLTWIMSSTAFFLLGKSIGYSKLFFSQALVAMIISIVVGILIVFVPHGIVVRESVMVFLLGDTLSSTQVVLLSSLFRIEMLICELICVIIVSLLGRINQKHWFVRRKADGE